MSRVEVTTNGVDWYVKVDGKWVASFSNDADAEAWAEAKRAELAKAQPYYVDGGGVWPRDGGDWAVYVDDAFMPSGTPQVWQRKILALIEDLLNGGDLNDPRFKEHGQ